MDCSSEKILNWDLLKRIQAFENRFEADDRVGLNDCLMLTDSKYYNDFCVLHQLMDLYLSRQYVSVIELVERSLRDLDALQVKACALQFALMSSEMIFDLKRRENLIHFWSEVERSGSNEYVAYLKTFSYGLTAFYESRLFESANLFERALKLATKCHDIRGQARVWFHLGLVARDQGHLDRSQDYFLKSSKLAKIANLNRTLGRVQLAQVNLQQRMSLLKSLQSRDFKQFRKKYLEFRLERRERGESRFKDSHYQYLALYCALKDKSKIYQQILAKTKDQVIRYQILTQKIGLLGLSHFERSELELIGVTINRHQDQILVRSDADVQIAGLQLDQIKVEDIRKFIKLLLASKNFAATKEQICQEVWNIAYDPVIHDGKLYKFIHKVRKTLDSQDLIVNSYGGYQLEASMINIQQII